MVKNFFDYVKEIVPEKGSVFFTRYNHDTYNGLSLYQLADLIQGKRIVSQYEPFNHMIGVSGYSWKVERYYKYDFDTVGIILENESGVESWIHFSKDAFIGAICIVATKEGVTFDDTEYETIRQTWERKLFKEDSESDKMITNKNQSNFDEICFADKIRDENRKLKKNFLIKEKSKVGLSIE